MRLSSSCHFLGVFSVSHFASVACGMEHFDQLTLFSLEDKSGNGGISNYSQFGGGDVSRIPPSFSLLGCFACLVTQGLAGDDCVGKKDCQLSILRQDATG